MASTTSKTRRRYRNDPLMPASDPMPNANRIWHALAPLDETARQMETKWGIERLPCLVSETTAARFGMAREHLDDLLAGNDKGEDNLDAIEAAAGNLRRGWLAMDAEATAAGAQPFDPTGWAFMVGARKAIVVKDPAAAGHVQQLATDATVYTLDEIGNMLAMISVKGQEAITTAKQAFPGTVATVKPRSPLSDDLKDEIPF